MKATAEQLGKIQFLRWDHDGWVASFTNGGSVPVSLCRIEKGRCIVMADARLGEGALSWSVYGGSAGTVRDVLSKIDNLTGWMTRELASLDLAEKRERTKPEPGEGWEYCGNSESTHAAFYFSNRREWSEWQDSSHVWFTPHNLVNYIFRRPKKVEPKLPTVKAPEGCWWESDPRYGIRLAWSESPGCTSYKYVPRDAAAAERGKAVNAAFDEANGTITVEKSGSLSVTGVILRNGETLQLNTVYK